MLDHNRELKEDYFEPKFLQPGNKSINQVPVQDRKSLVMTTLTTGEKLWVFATKQNRKQRQNMTGNARIQTFDEVKDTRKKSEVNARKMLLQGANIQLHMIIFHSLWNQTSAVIVGT